MHCPCYYHGWPGRAAGDKFGAAGGPKPLQHHETVGILNDQLVALLQCHLLTDFEAGGGGLLPPNDP
jgi:hypothetical protein